MKLLNFINDNVKLDEQEEPIVQFGIDMLKMVSVSLLVAFIISTAMGIFFESVVLLVTLIPLRQKSGGYHSKSRLICAIMSMLIYILMLLSIKYMKFSMVVQLIDASLSLMVILNLAPVDTENNRLDYDEKQHYCKQARVIAAIDFSICVILLSNRLYKWSVIICWSMTIVAILLIVGHFINIIREGKDNDIQSRYL